jgi:hypothetical protein
MSRRVTGFRDRRERPARFGIVSPEPISAAAINNIVQRRMKAAGVGQALDSEATTGMTI